MKAKIHWAIIILWGLLAAASCNQDPIFSIISTETAPQKPRVEGAPTNMVMFDWQYQVDDPDNPGSQLTVTVPLLFVASGRLHWYKKIETNPGIWKSQWDSKEYNIPQPQGKIISLAAAQDRLYALCMDGHGVSTTLRYITNNGTEWVNIAVDSSEGVYTLIQSIYAAPETGQLFACTRNNKGDTYAILYLKDNTLKTLQPDTSIFSGMAYKNNNYYLCTRGAGIFKVDDTSFDITQLTDASDIEEKELKDNRTFMGMIKLNDAASTIIAIERNSGALFEVDADSFKQITYSGGDNDGEVMQTGKYATGALALWEKPGEPTTKMLIIGIQGGLSNTSSSSYTNGYVEFDLNTDASLNTASFRHDSNSLQSAPNNERYTTSLGKQPINHLFQAPASIDDEMTFFASTQTAGLWSYRDRGNNGAEWNAEE